jgi:hypothetical protein
VNSSNILVLALALREIYIGPSIDELIGDGCKSGGYKLNICIE